MKHWKRWVRIIGSLKIAVPVLVGIATVLAWGTFYEARYGTAAVQRFVYTSWYFQLLLGFLAVNLAAAAFERYPWKRQHAPFLLAHLGIILILIGGILGGRFGIDGQLIIPEGGAERLLQLSHNVLAVQELNPGLEQVIPTRFETQAWVHQPNLTLPVRLGNRAIQLTVDRYYPDAVVTEEITDGGPEGPENPAIHLLLEHGEEQEDVWLLARDPERFGIGWGEAHVLFLEPQSEAQLQQLMEDETEHAAPRGVVSVKLPRLSQEIAIPVPEELGAPIRIKGTPYAVTFKDYFPDFVMTEQGLGSRSDQPHNPAVSFVLTGPEGDDPYLLFALHPEFQTMHGFQHPIAAEVSYTHSGTGALPPNTIGIIRTPKGTLTAVLTDAAGHREMVERIEVGATYTHPSLGQQFQVAAYDPRARLTQHVDNRSDELHAEAVHLIGREGDQTADAWLLLRGSAELPLGREPIRVEYRPAQRELPVTIKLLDFRKIDYPGSQMAEAFESDVQMSDAERGVILMRKIYMNHPLRYRGFSFFQSSYVPGSPETTVLSVRNDPGTPLVYAGFLIVIAGVVGMFLSRQDEPKKKGRSRT